MANVVVCGDSFCCTDADYGNYTWVENLQTTHNLVNLASVCASNLLISLQIEQAISLSPDYIIVSFTSVTRSEVTFAEKIKTNLLDRFYKLTGDNLNCDLVSYSIHNTKDALALSAWQRVLLNQYNKTFYDLDLAIYRDRCIIENSLHKLFLSNIPFVFDQGGFEHKSYNTQKTYFKLYDSFRSRYNLWDYADKRNHRPYFHVTDVDLHQQIGNYYNERIFRWGIK